MALDLADSPRKSITVAGLVLSGPIPYTEGHVLVANEAMTLNQTWLENLRNNFAAKANKHLVDLGHSKKDESGDDIATPEECTAESLAVIQAAFLDYAAGYEFGVRGGREADPVRAQALEMAKGKVREKLKAGGYTLSDVGNDRIKELAEQGIERNPNFMIKAKEIVDARNAANDELSIEL